MKLAILAVVLLLASQSGTRPEFDVATVKSSPAVPLGEPININLGRALNGRVTLTNASLNDCIKYAYGITSDSQIVGPDWSASMGVRFDIVAQAPPNTPQDQLLLMLQTPLANRLKLVLHHEQKPLSYLALIVSRSGAKMPEAKDAAAAPTLAAGHVTHHHMSMPLLATLLSRFERQLILDRTDLNGFFDVRLEWTPEAMRGRVPEGGGPVMLNGAGIDPNGPALATALQEQLGLRLESRKGPVDVLIIDHAEKVPTSN